MRRDLSIMVTRGLGKVRQLQTSSLFLLGSFLFFAVFLIISVFVINEYIATRRENTTLRKHVAALEQRKAQAHRKLYRIQQQVALLKDYIRLLEKPSAKSSPEAYSDPLPLAGKPVQKEKKPAVQKKFAKATGQKKARIPEEPIKAPVLVEQQEETGKPMVSVQDPLFQRKNTRLTISFKLAKTAEDAIPLRGYLHMIIVDKNVAPPLTRTFPHEVLKNGIPVRYKRGQLFVIKHFKVVRGKFFLGGTKQSPDSVRIFVYNKDGLLLLDKELELKKGT